MYRRQLSKLHRYAVILISYLTVYLVISFVIAPDVTVSFVSDDIRVGDKFVLFYLVAPNSPAFTDVDGAEVFSRCGKCYITNNKGFLPVSEYDAVLTLGDRLPALSSDAKSYIIQATTECLRDKLKGCIKEPRITSLITKQEFDLCGLCKHLHEMRKHP